MAVKKLLAKIVRIIWVIVILVILVAASYQSLGRVMLPRLPQYQQYIEDYISDRLGSRVGVGSMTGSWDNFQPIIDLYGVTLSPPDFAEPYVVSSIHLQLDVFSSLFAWQPVFTALVIEGVDITATQDEQGGWSFGGLLAQRASSDTDPLLALGRGLDLLLSQGHIVVRKSKLQLAIGDESQTVQIDDWRFDCVEEFCSSVGRIRFEEEQQSQLLISMNLSDFGEGEDFKLEAFLELEPLRLEKWVPLLNLDTPINFSWERFQLGGKVWLTWEGDAATDIRGSLSSSELKLTPGGEQLDPVQYISSDFVWQKNSGRANELWSLWLNDFTFKWKEELFEPAQQRWSMSGEDGVRRLHVVADSLDLAFTNNTLLAIQQLPQKIRSVLATLSPHGRLANAHVTYVLGSADREDAPPDVQLEAELEDVGVSAWRNVPAGNGVDGYIRVTPNGGLVDFRSTGLTMHFPRFYSRPMEFDQATGLVNWRNKGRGVWLESGLISLVGSMGTVEGHFSSATPRDGAEPRFEMLLALRDAEVRETLGLVPDQSIDKGLVRWLNEGIVSGRANQGRFLYSGSTLKGAPRELSSMQLLLEVEDVELAYHSDWPALTGLTADIDVTQESAEIHATVGRLLDLEFDRLDASWGNQDKTNVVNIQSHVRGAAADGISLLTDTPVRDALFDLIDDFAVTGLIEADIDLEIPISDAQQPRVNLSLLTNDMQLEIPSLGLAFVDISGQFDYQTELGISSKRASASLFDRPVTIEVSSAPESPDEDGEPSRDPNRYSTRMVMRGEIDAASLYSWEPLPIFTRFYGKTSYEAVLAVSDSGTDKFTVTSDLEGITFDAPAPFGKVAAENIALRYEIELADVQIHRLGYADLLQTALVLEDGSYDRGEVRLGAEPAIFEDVPGISVRGTVGELRLLDWWDFFAELDSLDAGPAGAPVEQGPVAEQPVASEVELPVTAATEAGKPAADSGQPDEPVASAPQSLVSRLKEIEITVDHFLFGQQRFENLILQMEQIEQDWWAHLENEAIKGRVRFFADTSKPAILEFEYLRLPGGDSEAEEEDFLVDIVPQDIPAFDFSADSVWLGEEDYGKWIFNYRPSSTGARMEQLIADVKGLQLVGELTWDYVDAKHGAGFSGTAHSRNLDKMMTAWGYPHTMKGKSLNINADLTWPGSPVQVAPERVSGPMSIAAGEGRFTDLDSAPEGLKMVGLFNLSAIARRIRLDFSDITKKGFSFDTINAELMFSEGIVSTRESLIINGPSAKLKLDGTTDLINEEFDQKLVAVIPLSENIPIAATVLGAPQVGIPLWLLNKAFGNMFDAFQSVEYRVTGPIADPLIETTARYEKRISEAKAAVDGAIESESPAPAAPDAGPDP